MAFLKTEDIHAQLFWEGRCDKEKERYKGLENWFGFACRAPHLRGHVILANKKYCENLNMIPEGFESAFNRVGSGLITCARGEKGADILLVFYRMNIAQEQFRVHIVPVSQCERELSSTCLQRRIKKDKKGGMVYFLGQREDKAEQRELEFDKLDDQGKKNLLKASGMTDFVHELRETFDFEVPPRRSFSEGGK